MLLIGEKSTEDLNWQEAKTNLIFVTFATL